MQEIKRLTDVISMRAVLDGPKVLMKDILGRQLVFTGWHIGPSRYKDRCGNYKRCLTLQFEANGIHNIVQTSSAVLIEQIEAFEVAAPGDKQFLATIQEHDGYFMFV